jgi:hypothetical protein
VASREWQIGLLDGAGNELSAAAGYQRATVMLPDDVLHISTMPVVFCAARADWPAVVFAAVYRPGTTNVASLPVPVRSIDLSAPQPLHVKRGEQVLIPAGSLLFRYLATAALPRPYGVGHYGIGAYSRWLPQTIIQFAAGATLLADVIDAPCAPWVRVPAAEGCVCA